MTLVLRRIFKSKTTGSSVLNELNSHVYMNWRNTTEFDNKSLISLM